MIKTIRQKEYIMPPQVAVILVKKFSSHNSNYAGGEVLADHCGMVTFTTHPPDVPPEVEDMSALLKEDWRFCITLALFDKDMSGAVITDADARVEVLEKAYAEKAKMLDTITGLLTMLKATGKAFTVLTEEDMSELLERTDDPVLDPLDPDFDLGKIMQGVDKSAKGGMNKPRYPKN